jgi:hypothetical protein
MPEAVVKEKMQLHSGIGLFIIILGVFRWYWRKHRPQPVTVAYPSAWQGTQLLTQGQRLMKTEFKQPLWVKLAFSSISTRKGALMLTLACLLFTIYCLPWSTLLADVTWVSKVFLINDWSWFAIMVPITFWYWISLIWMDNHSAW